MANEIDRLEIQVQTQAQKANAELDKMANRLEKVGGALTKINASGLQGLANGIGRLSASMQQINGVKTTDFTRLARNIEKLGNIDQSKINSTASAIKTISSALTASTGLTSGAAQITELANSVSKLGYKSASNAITNIPLMANALKDLMRTLSTSPQVSRNLIDMTNAISNLASQGSKVRSATKSIDSSLKTYSTSTKQAASSTRAFTFSLASLYAKIWAIRRAIKGIWGSVEKSMDYTETINLFQTSFKKIGVDAAEEIGLEMGSVASEQFGKAFIDRATDFNRRITEALSLDPDLMMNYQAVFAQMANSMNLTAASALNISESFTLLGNDIASLWNIDTDVAMKKLQSGLAGQIRPLRELGVDISKTSLEMYALKYGIEDSVEKMSQAAKVQLRWLAIMEQTEVAFGDMAKTIQSPANQLRVLQQQWTNLSRSIGSVFLPVVTTVLPYINAVVIALRRMIDAFATAVGFELPDYSDTNIYKDITTDIEGIGEEAEGAKEFVDSLKKSLMSFDELNILSDGSKGINFGIDNLGDGYDQLDDAINQKTISYMAKFNEELAKMQNRAEELADKIQPKLEKVVKGIDDIKPAIAGAAGAFATYKIVTLFENLGGSLLALSPKGLAVSAIVGGLALVYAAVKEHNEKLVKEDLASRFGEIALSMEEIEDVAERLTTNKYTAKIDIAVSEAMKLEEIEKDIEKNIATLNKLNWKVSVGLELTEGEIAEYKSTIESFISNMNAYIEQQHYVATLAVDAVIQDGNFKTEISQLVDRYFDGSKGEMERLGKQLRSTMDEALADGILDAEEQKVINSLMKEMAEIQSRIADAKFTAKLQAIELEGDLTAESYKKLFKEIQSQIEERSKQAEELSVELLTVVNAQYQIDMKNATTPEQKVKIQRAYEKDIKQITENLSKTKAKISYEGISFATNTLTEKWGAELSSVENDIKRMTEGMISKAAIEGIKAVDPSAGIQEFVHYLRLDYEQALSMSGMDKASRAALEEMLDSLKPTEEDNKAIYDEALKSGSQIPQGISDELTAIQNLRILTGDIDAIYYMIGQQLANSPEILTMLNNGEITAHDLNDSIIRGLKSKIPDLKKQGKDLIFDLDDAVKSATETKKKTVPNYAKSYIGEYGNTFKKDTSATKAVKEWLSGIDNVIKNHKLPTMTQMVQLKLDAAGIESTGIEFLDTQKALLLNKVKGYASGGMPNTGELFMARENGITEYIGGWGNRTAVANNDQIKEGIADAVKGAMIEVLVPVLSNNSNNDGVIDNRIYLDSNILYEAMERVRYKKSRQNQTSR